jgi:predicted O-methyltransferase YrrM
MKPKTENLVNAFGFLYMEEAELLMYIADKLKQNAVVVNVGAGVGTSSLAIIEQRPDLAKTFYTVDIRDDDNPFGGLLNERNAFHNAKMDNLLPAQIKGDSSTVGMQWDKGEIDLLIIDAEHLYDGVVKDINAWTPHLAVDGFLAFHDYERDKWPDVKTAVDEFVSTNPEYVLEKHVMTMIIYKKTKAHIAKTKITKDLSKEEQAIVEQKAEAVEKETEVENKQNKPTKSTSTKRASTKKG